MTHAPWTRRVGRLLRMDFDYVAHGGSWLTADHAVNVATSFVTTYVLANAIEPESYGAYLYILAIAMFLLPLTLTGVSNAMIRSLARGFDGVFARGVRRRLAWSLAGGGILVLLGPVFALTGREDLVAPAIAAGIGFALAFGADDYKTWYHARREFRSYAFVNGAINIAVASATMGAALAGGGPAWILAANIGTRGAANSIATLAVWRRRANDNVEEGFDAFGRNLSWIAALNNVSFTIDQVLVGTFYDLPVMAVYGLATRLSEPFRVIGTVINRLAWPKAVTLEARDAARKFLSKLAVLVAVLTALALVTAAAFPFVLRLFFPAYANSWPLVLLMIASALLSVVVTYLETYYISQDHLQRTYYLASTIRPTLTIALIVPFLAIWGIYGAVIARLVVRFGACVVLTARMLPERHRVPIATEPAP
ncbi:lipopolysaccharide biosynthesis protein [bacterium]|nr:lipopolysaccharide biosynthesis protein [bacterium]